MRITVTLLISILLHLALLSIEQDGKHIVSNDKGHQAPIYFSVMPVSGLTQLPALETKRKKSSSTHTNRMGKKITSKKDSGKNKVLSTTTKTPQDGLQALNIQMSYPLSAVRKKAQGTVIVEVSLTEGKVTKQKIIKSSGHQELDYTVIQALKKATSRQKEVTIEKMKLVFRFKL